VHICPVFTGLVTFQIVPNAYPFTIIDEPKENDTPTNLSFQDLESSEQSGIVSVEQTDPVNVEQTSPVNVEQTGPVNVEQTDPVNVEQTNLVSIK